MSVYAFDGKTIVFKCPTTQHVYSFLSKSAKAGKIETYTSVGDVAGIEPHNHDLWKILGNISEATNKCYGVMLSALVVNFNKGTPGGAFFELGKSFGRKVNDPLRFWTSEYRRVHEIYKEI